MSKPWYAYSDHELGIKGRWFTGEEWANGTAQRESIRELVELAKAKDNERMRIFVDAARTDR